MSDPVPTCEEIEALPDQLFHWARKISWRTLQEEDRGKLHDALIAAQNALLALVRQLEEAKAELAERLKTCRAVEDHADKMEDERDAAYAKGASDIRKTYLDLLKKHGHWSAVDVLSPLPLPQRQG